MCTIVYYFQVLPYWNWAKIYSEECVIENPYFEFDKLMKEDCYVRYNIDHDFVDIFDWNKICSISYSFSFKLMLIRYGFLTCYYVFY